MPKSVRMGAQVLLSSCSIAFSGLSLTGCRQENSAQKNQISSFYIMKKSLVLDVQDLRSTRIITFSVDDGTPQKFLIAYTDTNKSVWLKLKKDDSFLLPVKNDRGTQVINYRKAQTLNR